MLNLLSQGRDRLLGTAFVPGVKHVMQVDGLHSQAPSGSHVAVTGWLSPMGKSSLLFSALFAAGKADSKKCVLETPSLSSCSQPTGSLAGVGVWEGSWTEACGDHGSEGSCLWLCLLSCAPLVQLSLVPPTTPPHTRGGRGFPGLLAPGCRHPLRDP